MADFVSHPLGLHLQSAIGVCADTARERMISGKEIRSRSHRERSPYADSVAPRARRRACAARNLVSEEECIRFSNV